MDKNKVLNAYKKMFLLRKMEEELVKYYFDNKIMSFVHFYIGQEAVAVGVCENLTLEDRVFGNHRSHGHYLAKGGCPNAMAAELLGKITGCCKGKGGSMHMIDKSVNFTGSTPILGSAAPISCGSSFEQKISGSNNITVGFIGDGASEEGVVYETINFASLFKLPYLLVIENNHYSVMTPMKDRRADNHNMQQIVEGFGAKYIKANGNDFFDVFEKTSSAIEIIKLSKIPVVLECMVYRHMAHSAPICDDKVGYRNVDDNPENRMKEDSVKRLRDWILINYDFDELHLLEIEKEISTTVANSIKFAVESSLPDHSELEKDVYHV